MKGKLMILEQGWRRGPNPVVVSGETFHGACEAPACTGSLRLQR